MKTTKTKTILTIAILTLLLAYPVFSQENTAAQKPDAPAVPVVPPSEAPNQAKEIAIYGEVQSVDAAKSVLTVQYYDYDSDSEKTSEVAVKADTKLENAPTIAGIKKGDWVDVTYVVKDGINVASIITVEKEELPATEEEAVKQASPAVKLPAEQ